MKITGPLLLIVTLAAAGLTGCAPAKLTVHVDLYRYTALNDSGRESLAQLQAWRKRLDLLDNDIAVFMDNYRKGAAVVRSNQLANAMTLKEVERAPAIKNAETAYALRLRNAQAFADDNRRQFATLHQALDEAMKYASALMSGNDKVAGAASDSKAHVESLIGQLNERLQVEFEVSRTTGAVPRLLAGNILRKLSDAVTELASQARKTTRDWADGKTDTANAKRKQEEANQAGEISRVLEAKVTQIPEAGKELEKLSKIPHGATNPDLLADDGDPFYQIIASDHATTSWSTNFFFQNITSAGKVSFLIVRETPVRFCVNEAKTDPTVLIRTQLRAARAGINTVAAVAKAMNPALAALPQLGGGGADSGAGSNATAGATGSLAVMREEQEQIKVIAGRIQDSIKGFQQDLKTEGDKAGATPAGLDSWAKSYFIEKVSPSLKSYGNILDTLVPAVPAPAPPAKAADEKAAAKATDEKPMEEKATDEKETKIEESASSPIPVVPPKVREAPVIESSTSTNTNSAVDSVAPK